MFSFSFGFSFWSCRSVYLGTCLNKSELTWSQEHLDFSLHKALLISWSHHPTGSVMRPQTGTARGLALWNQLVQQSVRGDSDLILKKPFSAGCELGIDILNLEYDQSLCSKATSYLPQPLLFLSRGRAAQLHFFGLGKPCSMDGCSQFSYSLCLWMRVGMGGFTVHSSDMRSKPCQRHFGVIEEQKCIEVAERDLGRVWSPVTENRVAPPLFPCSGMPQGCQSMAWLRCPPFWFNRTVTSAAVTLSVSLTFPYQNWVCQCGTGKIVLEQTPSWHKSEKLFGNLVKWSCFLWAVSWFPRTKSLSFLNIQLPLGHKELWWIGALYSFLLLLNSYLQTEVIKWSCAVVTKNRLFPSGINRACALKFSWGNKSRTFKMKVSSHALRSWGWSGEILVIHSKKREYFSAGFRDEVMALSLNSEAFSEVCSATAIFAKHIFQTIPTEMKWDREKIRWN